MLDFHWLLPTYGDSRDIVGAGHGRPAGAAGGDRPATLDHLAQVASAAEQMGFCGAMVPTGAWCEDAWVTTAMLVRSTRWLRLLAALRPGLASPTLAAQMAATLQWHSQGRLALNVVTGDSHEQRRYGDFLDQEARYARCDEFLSIVRRLWADEAPLDFHGRHLSVADATLQRRPDPAPPLYFGGSSPAAGQVAARHIDTYLTCGEPVPVVAERLRWIRGLAQREGRPMRFGVRLRVISRDTSEAAWAQARRLPDLTVSPHLPAGVGPAPGGAGTALVGSHEEVAERIEEYADLGISELVLSGYPHLEEVHRFGECVLPILRARGLWTHPDTARLDADAEDAEDDVEDTEGAEDAVPFAVA